MRYVVWILLAPVLAPVALAGWLWGLLTSRPYDLPYARRGWQVLLTWPGQRAWRWGVAHREVCASYGVGVALLAVMALVRQWGDHVPMPSRGVVGVGQAGRTLAPLVCGAGDAGKQQINSHGELEYCDGANTLHGMRPSVPTQSGLTWALTQPQCVDGAQLTVNADNQLLCATE